MTDEGFAALKKARRLRSLELMNARRLTDERLHELVRSLPLEELSVYDVRELSDEALLRLVKLKRLKRLRAFGSSLTRSGRESLYAARPEWRDV